MADWSSLPSDLINRVADCFLATNDLDYYMDFRGVCSNWRSSTADPKASPDEPRFRPRSWVMLHEQVKFFSDRYRRDDTLLFLNAATGRFLRKDLPLLRRYYLVASTSGGFLVLADMNHPFAALVLNPFTGSLTRFMAPVPPEFNFAAAVVGSVHSFTLVLASGSSRKVYWADPESEAFLFEMRDRPSALLPCIAANCTGRSNGSVLTAAKDQADEMETRTFAAGLGGGEILFATFESHRIRVSKTNSASADQGVLEPVTSIGRHALFVGDRCLLVDADKLPSIDANCIYYQVDSPDSYISDDIYMYDLGQGMAEKIAVSFSANPVYRHDDHPATLIQLLVGYTMEIPDNELTWEGIPDKLDTPCMRDLQYDKYHGCFDD